MSTLLLVASHVFMWASPVIVLVIVTAIVEHFDNN